jgi:hypothetical protein
MKYYYSETTGGLNVKWAAAIQLNTTALMLMAMDNVNRHEFLPAVRQLLKFEDGEAKGTNTKGETIAWSESDKAAFQIQREMLDSDAPVNMLRFVAANDSDIRGALAKYDASEKKAAFCEALVQRGRLSGKEGVPADVDALIAAVREHDAVKLMARRDQATRDFESGVVKVKAGKKLAVNVAELL